MLDKIDISLLSFDEIEMALRVLVEAADEKNWETFYEYGKYGEESYVVWKGYCSLEDEALDVLKKLTNIEEE